MTNLVTMDQVVKALPTNLRTNVTQQLVDNINNIANDPLIAEQISENFISYTSVLKDGKFKIEDYLNAVTYVSFKLMEYSNEQAWFRTFPQRHAALVAKGTPQKDIASHVSAYNKNKLVNLILEQTLIPTHVMNQHIYQKAINVQADLMMNAQSEKVRTDAANSLLINLKKPENKNFQINMDTVENSGMREMREALTQLAQAQQQAIQQGNMKTIDIAASKISVVEDTDAN